jgi:uroporphyrinogen-III synthase
VLQEAGTPNRALARELSARGALVSRLSLYHWAMPEDPTPLLRTINEIIEGCFDVVLFTNGTQVWHLFKLAYKNGVEDELREAISRVVVASIGASCSEALHEFNRDADVEPEAFTMSALVQSAARFTSLHRTQRSIGKAC